MTALLREGDVVSVSGVVLSSPFDFDGTSKVKIRVEPYHDIFVLASDVSVVRPEFRVGDTVELVVAGRFGAPVLGEVKAIDGDSLWVRRLTGGLDTWEMNRVRRADPDEPQAADPDPVEPPPAPLDGKVGSEVAEEEQQREAEAEEPRRLENEEMEKHFEKHPHG